MGLTDTFEKFAGNYQFSHVTSSPYYLQGTPWLRGLRKRWRTFWRNLVISVWLSSTTDRHHFLGVDDLLQELLMGRSLWTTLPQAESHMTPWWTYLEQFQEDDQKFRNKQSRNYDQRHRVHLREDIPVEHLYGLILASGRHKDKCTWGQVHHNLTGWWHLKEIKTSSSYWFCSSTTSATSWLIYV